MESDSLETKSPAEPHGPTLAYRDAMTAKLDVDRSFEPYGEPLPLGLLRPDRRPRPQTIALGDLPPLAALEVATLPTERPCLQIAALGHRATQVGALDEVRIGVLASTQLSSTERRLAEQVRGEEIWWFKRELRLERRLTGLQLEIPAEHRLIVRPQAGEKIVLGPGSHILPMESAPADLELIGGWTRSVGRGRLELHGPLVESLALGSEHRGKRIIDAKANVYSPELRSLEEGPGLVTARYAFVRGAPAANPRGRRASETFDLTVPELTIRATAEPTSASSNRAPMMVGIESFGDGIRVKAGRRDLWVVPEAGNGRPPGARVWFVERADGAYAGYAPAQQHLWFGDRDGGQWSLSLASAKR